MPLQASARVTFPIFMSVMIGSRLRTAKNFYDYLTRMSIEVSEFAQWILGYHVMSPLIKNRLKAARVRTEMNLVKATVADLGFNKPATFAEIILRILDLGYVLCPEELGPQLGGQYGRKQPEGEELLIAMEAVHFDVSILIFRLMKQSGRRQLRTIHTGHGEKFPLDSLWAFVAPANE